MARAFARWSLLPRVVSVICEVFVWSGHREGVELILRVKRILIVIEMKW